MPDLNGRVVQCDATVLSVSASVLALATECTLNITCDEIDTTAPMDYWKQRAQCVNDWSMSVGKLIKTTPVFGQLIVTGGVVVVSANLSGGEVFLGSGLMTGWTHNWDSPQNETLTIVSAGGMPTLTPS